MAQVIKSNQYLATFTFQIPVQVIAEKSVENEKIEAYYKARDIFFGGMTLTDAEMKIEHISVDEYERLRAIETKMKRYK